MRHDPAFHRARRRVSAAPLRFPSSPAPRRHSGLPSLVAAALMVAAIGHIVGSEPAHTSAATGPRFDLCDGRGGRADCVVDGDTFRLGGEKVRIADIDTPETHPPRCAEEAALGARATERLRVLLNAGPFTLTAADRATDRYGRRLAIVMRDGRSIGAMMVADGLARPWEGRRRPWCAGMSIPSNTG